MPERKEWCDADVGDFLMKISEKFDESGRAILAGQGCRAESGTREFNKGRAAGAFECAKGLRSIATQKLGIVVGGCDV